MGPYFALIFIFLQYSFIQSASARSSPQQSNGAEQSTDEMVSLAKKLHEMVLEDQAVRLATPFSAERMREVDERNHGVVVRIYQEYGWPTFSMLGEQGAQDYWLLVQHQTLDFQRKVLPAMEKAMEKKEASKASYAYLYDRVMIGEGKPQHWGTQGKCEDGKAKLQPVDDPTHLEQRRREAGIYPASEEKYLKLLASHCAAANPDTTGAGQRH